MARTPRAKVSASSGQGVSRKAYQTAYKLGGDARVKGEFSSGGEGNRYAKSSKRDKVDYPKGINVSYGDTYFPTDLKDIQSVGERKPPGSPKLGRRKSKLKGPK
jgi:hypothetical protein